MICQFVVLAVLDFLLSKQLISRRSSASEFADSAKFRDILLSKDDDPFGMQFVGRDLQLKDVVDEVNANLSFSSVDSDRTSVVIVHGIPGSGKSRFLAEVGNRMITNSAIVLAITFNNNHGLRSLDYSFFEARAVHLPLCFRLLHAYAGTVDIVNQDSFDAWYERIEIALQSVDEMGFFALTVLSVIDFLRGQSGAGLAANKYPVLCLVDEVLMPWNEGKSNLTHTWLMMKSMYTIQGWTNQFAAVFSTLSPIGKFEDEKRSSGRSVFRKQLFCLENQPASMLVKYFIRERDSFFGNFHMSVDELAARILASVSSLPRALRFAFTAFKNAEMSHRHLSLREILESVALGLSTKYQLSKEFSSNLLILAVLGIRVLGNDVSTAEIIFRRGDASRFEAEIGILQLNPVQLLSYSIQYSKRTSIQVQKSNQSSQQKDAEVDAYLADDLRRMCNAPNSNRNIFEQVHHAQLHLRCHHYHRSRDQGDVTVLDIFPGSRILMGPQEWLNSRIDFTVDISRTIYVFCSIPTPEQMANAFYHLLCVPDDPRFPGIDGILFLRRPGQATRSHASTRWLVVGLQEKWSTLNDQSVDVSQLASSEQKFRCMMRRRGWPAESLLFVAIQRQDLPDYLVASEPKSVSQTAWTQSFESKVGNMIVIANNSSPAIGSYLGPSIFDLLEQFYLAPFGTDFVDLQSIFQSPTASHDDRNAGSGEKSFQTESLKFVSDVYEAHGAVFTAYGDLMKMANNTSFQRNSLVWSDSAFKKLSDGYDELMSRAREIDWSIEDVEQFRADCSALVSSVTDFIRQNKSSASSGELEIAELLAAAKI
jgi:hypothetical protein